MTTKKEKSCSSGFTLVVLFRFDVLVEYWKEQDNIKQDRSVLSPRSFANVSFTIIITSK